MPNLFEQKRIAMWQQITWSTPKIFKKNRYAVAILLSKGKEIKIKNEIGFFKATLLAFRP